MVTRTAEPASTPTARRVIQAIVAAYVAAWIGAAVIAGAGFDGAAAGVVAVAFLVIGAAVGWATSRTAGRWSSQEIRDGALGWGIVAAVLLAVPCFVLPMPWSILGAVVAVALVVAAVAAIRRAA